MKLSKRKCLYIVCGVIIAICIGVNIHRQSVQREAMLIEAHYKSIYGVEKKQQLAALQSMYGDLVYDIKDYHKSDEWREGRLKELCMLLDFNYGYHGQHFMINDFAEINRKHHSEDMDILREKAEQCAKAAETKARAEGK